MDHALQHGRTRTGGIGLRGLTSHEQDADYSLIDDCEVATALNRRLSKWPLKKRFVIQAWCVKNSRFFHEGMREMKFERTFQYPGEKWLALVSAGGALGVFASEDEWSGSKMVPLSIIALR